MRCYVERDGAIRRHFVPAVNLFSPARTRICCRPLFVNCRLLHAQFAAFQHDEQSSVGVQSRVLGPLCTDARDFQPQIACIHSRRDSQIVFHTFVVAVCDDVHTGQDLLRFRRREMSYVRSPLRRIAAEEIIAFALQRRHALPREILFTVRAVRRWSCQLAGRFRLTGQPLSRWPLREGILSLMAGSVPERHVLAVATPARSWRRRCATPPSTVPCRRGGTGVPRRTAPPPPAVPPAGSKVIGNEKFAEEAAG